MQIGAENDKKGAKKSAAEDQDYISLSYQYRSSFHNHISLSYHYHGPLSTLAEDHRKVCVTVVKREYAHGYIYKITWMHFKPYLIKTSLVLGQLSS